MRLTFVMQMSLFTCRNFALRAENRTGSKMYVASTADSSDRISCIPETFAALISTHRGDYFDTKFNVLGASFAGKIEF